MGKSYSRAVKHKGDPQVKVINTLEKHTTAHSGHDIKLLVILVLVAILLVITLHREYARRMKKRAAKLTTKIDMV